MVVLDTLRLGRMGVRMHSALVIELLLLGVVAGALGSVIGIGGGIVLVPALVLGFGVDMRIAVASSLIAVVATSSAAGSVYVGEGLANMRLGMSLEVATTLGGITGGLLALRIPEHMLAGIFGALMLPLAVALMRRRPRRTTKIAVGTQAGPSKGWEERGRLAGGYFDANLGRVIHYQAIRLGLGGGLSFVAGMVSGLLGVGGGFLKVPAMTLGMHVPVKVAAATSNFMIGVTAIASLFVYFARGYVAPPVAVPVALGVTAGALGGTRIAAHISPRSIRWMLALVLAAVAIEMILRAFSVHLGF